MRCKAKEVAREPPEQTEWVNLVRLDAMDAFSRWLCSSFHGWHLLPPQEGELLPVVLQGAVWAVKMILAKSLDTHGKAAVESMNPAEV